MNNRSHPLPLILVVLIVLLGYYSCNKQELMLEPLVKIDNPDEDKVKATNAEVDGEILDVGEGIEQHGHCYSSNGEPTIDDQKTKHGNLNSVKKFSSLLQNLAPNTTYYLKAYAISNGKPYYSAVKKINTLSGLANVTTSDINTDSIFNNRAVCSGNVTSVDGDVLISKGLCWHTENDLNLKNYLGYSEEGENIGVFFTNIQNLEVGITYYVRAYAITSIDTTYGEIKSFATKYNSPKAVTFEATNVTFNSAQLNGEVNARGVSTETTFEYRPVENSDWITVEATPSTLSGHEEQSVNVTISDLQSDTNYEFRVVAESEGGKTYGNEITFKTSIQTIRPSVVTNSANDVTETSATLNGNVTSDGNLTVTSRGFYWSTSDTSPDSNDNVVNSGSGTGTFSSSLTNLSPNTTYYYVAWAKNSKGEKIGEVKLFKTNIETSRPFVITNAATNVKETSATLNGNVTSDGNLTVTSRGFYWSASDTSPDSGDNVENSGNGTGSFSSSLTNLSPNTTYYYVAWAKNSKGEKIGEVKLFKTNTETIPPSAITKAATNISPTSARLNGEVNANGPNTTVSFEYRIMGSSTWESVSASPSVVSGNNPVSVNAMVYNLETSKTYYFRVKAESEGGETIGDELDFITSCEEPNVSTLSVENVSNHGSELNGEVTSGCTITSRGFYMSDYDSSPDSGDDVITAENADDIFKAFVSTLQPNTTYYVRAWAENNEGVISTGLTETFTTPEDEPFLNKELTFFEDFANNDREWFTGDESFVYDSTTFNYGASVVDGIYKIYYDQPHFWRWSFTMKELGTPVLGSNYEIIGRIKIQKLLGDNNDPEAGICWLDSEYLYVIMIEENGEIWYKKLDRNNNYTSIEYDRHVVKKLNGVGFYNIIKIAAVDNEFKIFINGNYEVSYTRDILDLEDTKGAVSESESHIDYISVYQEVKNNKSGLVKQTHKNNLNKEDIDLENQFSDE